MNNEEQKQCVDGLWDEITKNDLLQNKTKEITMANIKEYSIDVNEFFLSELLDQYQKDSTGTEKNEQKEQSFTVFEGENQIGGITGRIHGNIFHIPLLAVNDQYRKSGIRKMLVEKLEDIANEEKIKHLIVSTQEYQALEFY